MNKQKNKKSNRIIILFSTLVVLIFITGLFYYSTRTNLSYSLYIADYIAVVFKSDDNTDNLSNDGFILSDAKELEGRDKKVVIINESFNQDKNINLAVMQADSIYVDLFDGLTPAREFDNSFGLNTPFEIKSNLSKDTNLKMVYNQDSGELSFVLEGQELIINNSAVELNDNLIFTANNIEPGSFLRVGDLIVDLATYDNDVTITLNDIALNGITKYKLVEENLLKDQNYSFEQGLWAEAVADCSAYLDGSPSMEFSLSNDSTDGARSLMISSNNHFACTLKTFDVVIDNENLYKLSFDYKNLDGNSIQYYYDLRNSINQVQEKFGLVESNNKLWNNFSTVIQPEINEADKLSVYFYAPSDGSKKVTNLFDNLKLTTFEFDRKISFPVSKIDSNISLSNWVKLDSGVNSFYYDQAKVNLLENLNSSFEEGLWLDQPADCSDYLPEEANISASLQDDATKGSKSLLISSKNHYACIFKSFPIELENNKIYQLSFDYKNIKGSKVQYYYNFSNEYNQSQEGFDSFEDISGNWKTHQVLIDPKIADSDNFDFYVYAPSDGLEDVVNTYDNIRLEEIAPKEIYSYFLYTGFDIKKGKTFDNLSFATTNRWKDNLELTGVTDSVFLVYPRQYSNRWHVYSHDYVIPEEFHYLVNESNNAWWLDINNICLESRCEINEDGSYDISLIIENDLNSLLIYFKLVIILLVVIFLFTFLYAWKK